MVRWNWKRWAWAIAMGTALVSGTTVHAEVPKVGETITLKFQGQPDRAVTVVKSTTKPDGSVETEVKDAKTGGTFMLIDPAPASTVKPAIPSMPPAPIVAKPPIAKPAATSTLPSLPTPVTSAPNFKPTTPLATPSIPMPLPPSVVPPVSAKVLPPIPPIPSVNAKPIAVVAKSPAAMLAEPPVVKALQSSPTTIPPMSESSRDKRPIGGRPGASGTAAPTSPTVTPTLEDSSKRPGMIGRLFGKKPTPSPAMPAVSTSSTTSVPSPSFNPPAAPRTNVEPPRIAPAKPVAPAPPGRFEPVLPPTPVVPPVAAPSTVPGPVLIPTPLPAKPVALPTPSIPIPLSIPSLPVIPAVGTKPTTGAAVTPASHTPIDMGLPEEIVPFATTLRDALAPSARITAAKALAEGRYGSANATKSVLFHAAQHDPCPAVKACCIEHLSKLGYFDPAFMTHLKACGDDASAEVRTAAMAAMVKMAPR